MTDITERSLAKIVDLVTDAVQNIEEGEDAAMSIALAATKIALLIEREPVPMVLFCPACGVQHIDEPEESLSFNAGSNPIEPGDSEAWTNPPHRSHLCHGCGHIWRPADVPTEGVAEIQTRGKADSPFTRPSTVDGGELAEMLTWLETQIVRLKAEPYTHTANLANKYTRLRALLSAAQGLKDEGADTLPQAPQP